MVKKKTSFRIALIIQVSVSPNERCQCPFLFTVKYSWSVSWRMLESGQTASTDSPFRQQANSPQKETDSRTELRTFNALGNRANSQHQLQQPIPTNLLKLHLNVCFSPLHVRCRRMCQAAAPGLVLLWAQAEVNRISVSVCASQRSTQDTLCQLQWLHLCTPGSLHLEGERGLRASVWHTCTHTSTLAPSLSLSLLESLCWPDRRDSDIYLNKCRDYSVVLRAKSNVKMITTTQHTFPRRRECNTQILVYVIKNPTTITGHLYFPLRILYDTVDCAAA